MAPGPPHKQSSNIINYSTVTVIVIWSSLFTCFLLSTSLGIVEKARDIKFVLFLEGISKRLGRQEKRHTGRNHVPGKCRTDHKLKELKVGPAQVCMEESSVMGKYIGLRGQVIVAESPDMGGRGVPRSGSQGH